MLKLSLLTNLAPEMTYLECQCVNIHNVCYYERFDLFVILHYVLGDKELIRFGSIEETEAAVTKLEKAFKDTYGY